MGSGSVFGICERGAYSGSGGRKSLHNVEVKLFLLLSA